MQKHLYFTDQDQPISGWLGLPGTVREKGSGDGVEGGDEEGEEGEEGAMDGVFVGARVGEERQLPYSCLICVELLDGSLYCILL